MPAESRDRPFSSKGNDANTKRGIHRLLFLDRSFLMQLKQFGKCLSDLDGFREHREQISAGADFV